MSFVLAELVYIPWSQKLVVNKFATCQSQCIVFANKRGCTVLQYLMSFTLLLKRQLLLIKKKQGIPIKSKKKFLFTLLQKRCNLPLINEGKLAIDTHPRHVFYWTDIDIAVSVYNFFVTRRFDLSYCH